MSYIDILKIIMYLFMAIGCFFAFAGVVGVLRMPDAYCRMQSSTNISTLGTLGMVVAGVIYSILEKNTGSAIKITLIGVFILLTNPIAGHAICRAAYRLGVRPEKEMVCDAYGRDKIDEQ